jgi:hypothetical protein
VQAACSARHDERHRQPPTSLTHTLVTVAQGAGTLKRGAGAAEDVAVKVVNLGHVSAAQAALAQRELCMMAAVSRALGGYVLRLRGFSERRGQLLLAMERASKTLAAAAASCPHGRLDATRWVRLHALCLVWPAAHPCKCLTVWPVNAHQCTSVFL